MNEMEEIKSCHKCIHVRACHFYLTMSMNREFGVFFKNYKINTFAMICDNYDVDKIGE